MIRTCFSAMNRICLLAILIVAVHDCRHVGLACMIAGRCLDHTGSLARTDRRVSACQTGNLASRVDLLTAPFGGCSRAPSSDHTSHEL